MEQLADILNDARSVKAAVVSDNRLVVTVLKNRRRRTVSFIVSDVTEQVKQVTQSVAYTDVPLAPPAPLPE